MHYAAIYSVFIPIHLSMSAHLDWLPGIFSACLVFPSIDIIIVYLMLCGTYRPAPIFGYYKHHYNKRPCTYNIIHIYISIEEITKRQKDILT